MTTAFLLTSSARRRTLLEDCANWAERLYVCAAAPMPQAAVSWLVPQFEKLAAFVAGPAFLRMAGDLVDPLRKTGALRIYGSEKGPLNTEVLVAQRGEQFRAMVAWASLFSGEPPGAVEVSTYVEGHSQDEEVIQLNAWFQQVLRNAQVPNPRLLESARALPKGGARGVSPSTPDAVPNDVTESANGNDEDADDLKEEDELDSIPFIDRSDEGRADLVWNLLIGHGRLKRDKAIRFAARSMRDEGLVAFGQLRKNGDLYQAILATIRFGQEQGWFEEVGRGYLRAVATELDVEDWLECLERALSAGPTAAAQAALDCAECATRYFGLKFQRLPSAGKIMSGIQEAIETAQERGLVLLNDKGELEWIGDDEDSFDDDEEEEEEEDNE